VDWNPGYWKKSTKLLLGVATIWPVIYAFLFVAIVFATVMYFSLSGMRASADREEIDLIQLEQKIQDRQISQLLVKPNEIIACDQSCECEYHVSVTNKETRAAIIRQALETDQSGTPRVAKVEENTSQPRVSPIGQSEA